MSGAASSHTINHGATPVRVVNVGFHRHLEGPCFLERASTPVTKIFFVDGVRKFCATSLHTVIV